ncbi:MAG: FecR domain-containing protein, partial [Candidatus Lustribacter sp.]
MQFSSGRRRGTLPSIVAVVLSLVAPFALPLAGAAQDDTTAPAPSSVARIDALGGDVAIVRGDENATLAAAPNAPILDGDYITTGPDGRAEVGFDGRSALRIGANVQLRLVTVHPANREIQLAAGTVELRLFGDTDGRSAIDTPSVSVVPRTAGSFRVAVDGNGETAVTVRAGSVDVETPQGERSLELGTT